MTTTMKTGTKADSKAGAETSAKAKTGSRKTPASSTKAAKPQPAKARPPKASTAKSGASKVKAATKPAQPAKAAKPAAAAAAKASKPGSKKPESKKPTLKKPSGLDLAAKILAESDQPLNAKEITERVIAAGWITTGKTPHATLYSAMLREIKSKGDKSRFRQAERGRFTGKGN